MLCRSMFIVVGVAIAHSLRRRKRSELRITLIELRLMAALAHIGEM